MLTYVYADVLSRMRTHTSAYVTYVYADVLSRMRTHTSAYAASLASDSRTHTHSYSHFATLDTSLRAHFKSGSGGGGGGGGGGARVSLPELPAKRLRPPTLVAQGTLKAPYTSRRRRRRACQPARTTSKEGNAP
jgi:hypothetical protein